MIIKDFFKTTAELDDFVLSIQVNEYACIEEGALKLYLCQKIIETSQRSVLFLGKKQLLRSIHLKKKSRHHHGKGQDV